MCNAHHLRELTFVFEEHWRATEHRQRWAKRMIELLLENRRR